MGDNARNGVSTLDLVLFALLACGGEQRFVGTDEVAIQAFRLFPLKFCWDTLTHLPSWDRVRQWLSEAKKAKHGSLVEGFSGDRKEGWKLTPAGVRRLRFKQAAFSGIATAAADERKYSQLPVEDLVVYAVDDVHRNGRTATEAVITETCVRRFPAVFELAGYAGWPDSSSVADALRSASVEGSLQVDGDRVALTDRGRGIAQELQQALDSESVAIRLEDIGRGLTHRAARDVEELTRSRAWALFRVRKPFSDGLACEAVQCSLQSHPKAIRRSLEHYRSAALELNRHDVVEFIGKCYDVLAKAIG